MCGIGGVYAPNETPDEGLLRAMNRVQRHRGPDSDGLVTYPGVGLAVERLKIIDLATGDQPISNEDGTVWVAFNGEIYNYAVLRERLASNGHRFRSQSDTEVLVHLYEEKGDAFLDDLNGMFALALWDNRRKRLLLARDRLGIKPLYYRWDGRRLLFASEVKGILADPDVPRALDPLALRDYLTFQNVFGGKTLFAGIRVLEPGHVLIAEAGAVTVRPYWDVTFRVEDGGEDGFARAFGDLLEDSVRMELMSDVPLGSHLSGGIDSGLIVSYAAKWKPDLDTFSITFTGSEFDEGPLIRMVAERAGTDHHEREVDTRTFPETFPRIVWHLDEPRVGPSVFPQYHLARLAREHVTVVLTGHGGDELFAGYPAHLTAALSDVGFGPRTWFRIAETAGRLREDGVSRVIGLPLAARRDPDIARYGHAAVFSRGDLARLLPANDATSTSYDPRQELDRVRARCTSSSALDRMLYVEAKTYLPSLLLVEDRMSMAHSLEDRVPLLDHRIAEFAARIPVAAKVHGLMIKNIPRRCAATRLPKPVVEHRKVGFQLPIGRWFREDLRPYVEREVLGGALQRLGISEGPVREVLRQHAKGADRTDAIWSLLNLAVWERVVLEGRGPT